MNRAQSPDHRHADIDNIGGHPKPSTMKPKQWILFSLITLTLLFGLCYLLQPLLVKPDPVDLDAGGHAFQAPQFVLDRYGPDAGRYFVPLVLAICTFAGIVASIMWQHATGRQGKWTWKAFAPILISPIVLFVTYAAAKDHPSGVIASLMAFENGFFWQVIIAGRGNKDAGG